MIFQTQQMRLCPHTSPGAARQRGAECPASPSLQQPASLRTTQAKACPQRPQKLNEPSPGGEDSCWSGASAGLWEYGRHCHLALPRWTPSLPVAQGGKLISTFQPLWQLWKLVSHTLHGRTSDKEGTASPNIALPLCFLPENTYKG